MSGFVTPMPSACGRQRHVLLDTEDRYDAWSTGREGPESYRDGMGLLMVYDGVGAVPCVTFNGPDGEVEFSGAAEISAVYRAMRHAMRLVEAFGPPLTALQWRQLNG